MDRIGRRDVLAMLALVAVGCAITIAWGERLGVNGGEGWDGRAYAEWARDLPATLRRGVAPYQAQRMLPAMLVYYAGVAPGLVRTHAAVITAFQLLDAAALVVAAALLDRIATLLAWSRAAAWAAFAASFLGFANARNALYNPVLTDPTAFALGMATAWAYLARRPIAQAVVTAAAAVTWPPLLPVGLVALVLPRAPADLAATTGRWHRWLAIVVGVVAAAIAAAWLIEELVRPYPGTERWLGMSHRALWPVTIACIVAGCAAAAYSVASRDRTWSVGPYLRAIGARRVALGAAAATAIVIAWSQWIARVGFSGESPDLRDMQHLAAAQALRGPLWDVVHHVVYFGPIVVVAIGCWRRLADTCARWGPAGLATLVAIVVIAVPTESRQLTALVPFAIVATIHGTAELWTPRLALIFTAVSLPWSKLWWPIGYDQAHAPEAWPDLRYTMHHGPWASDATFLAHLAGAVVTATVLAVAFRRAHRRR